MEFFGGPSAHLLLRIFYLKNAPSILSGRWRRFRFQDQGGDFLKS